MRYKIPVICLLMLIVTSLWTKAQNVEKKKLKDLHINEVKNADQVKVVKFLKEREDLKVLLQREDSINNVQAKLEDDEQIDAYYQRIEQIMAERNAKDSLKLLIKPPIPEYDRPLVLDSITGKVKPLILEAYWMDEFGEKIKTIYSDGIGYLFIRTQGYPISSKVTVTLKKHSGKPYASGEVSLERITYTDEDGIAILANNVWN